MYTSATAKGLGSEYKPNADEKIKLELFNKLGNSEKLLNITKNATDNLAKTGLSLKDKARFERQVIIAGELLKLVDAGILISFKLDEVKKAEGVVNYNRFSITVRESYISKVGSVDNFVQVFFEPDSSKKMSDMKLMANSNEKPDHLTDHLSNFGVLSFSDCWMYQGQKRSKLEHTAFLSDVKDHRHQQPKSDQSFATSSLVNIITTFPLDFQRVIAGRKLLSEVTSLSMSIIIEYMDKYFKDNKLSELKSEITALNDTQIASAWMMKLANNRGLSDKRFLEYLKRGQDIFTSNVTSTLKFEKIKSKDIDKKIHDLPAIAWFLKAKSGQNIFERGVTRLSFKSGSQDEWTFYIALMQKMKPRVSTHFMGSKVREKGYGIDIPTEKLRDHMPFQLGAMLLYPTAKDDKEREFAVRVSELRNKGKAEDIIKIYKEIFKTEMGEKFDDYQSLVETLVCSAHTEFEVFKIMNFANKNEFKIDLGIKFEDYGLGDRGYHTAVHLKVGKVGAKFNKKIRYIGSKKTEVKRAVLKQYHIKRELEVKMKKRKEHMTELPKSAQKHGLKIASLHPEITRGYKKRVQFKLFERVICLKSKKKRPISITHAIFKAREFQDTTVKGHLDKLSMMLSSESLLGKEGHEETLEI